MAASSRRALFGALGSNLAIALVKFAVGGLTASTVMIAEGIHSLVDTGNSALMLLGESRSHRAPDEEHPFGYGMELYFWSFVVAMVVFGGGGGLSMYEGVRALFHPRVVERVWPNYLVIGAASIFESGSLVIGLREFATYRRERRFVGSALAVMRASKNPAIFATVLEDSAALAGLALAALGLFLSQHFGAPAFEAVASILIGAVLMLEAGLLGYECRGLIIGEPARPIIVAEIRRLIALHPGIDPAFSVRTLQLGPDAVMLVLCLGAVPRGRSGNAEAAIQELVVQVRKEIPVVKDVVFEFRSPSVESQPAQKYALGRRTSEGGPLPGPSPEPK